MYSLCILLYAININILLDNCSSLHFFCTGTLQKTKFFHYRFKNSLLFTDKFKF